MPRKESEAGPKGNGPVPQQEEFGSGQPTLANVYRMVEERFDKSECRPEKLTNDLTSMNQRVASLEQDARQPRLAMEPHGPADTKTRERTEGTAKAVQAMHGDNFSSNGVQAGPKTTSTSFGVKVEPPALPCRDDIVVNNGAAAPKSYLSPLEMRSPTAAGGLLPTGKTSTATKTTFEHPTLWFCLTEDTDLGTSTPSTLYDSSFRRSNLLAASCRRVTETKSDKIGCLIQVVLKVVSAPACFWERGAPCFVRGLYFWSGWRRSAMFFWLEG